MDHAADDPLSGHRARETAARVEALEAQLARAERQPVEKPPGHAVHRGDDAGLRADERRDRRGHLGQVLRLDRNHDRVLRSKLRRVVICLDFYDRLVFLVDDLQAIFLDRCKVGTPCHDRDLVARLREPPGDQAADRAGAVNADFHGVILASEEY